MTKEQINTVVDSAFLSASKSFSRRIEKHIYPDFYNDPDYMYLRIEEAIAANNRLLAESLKQILADLLEV